MNLQVKIFLLSLTILFYACNNKNDKNNIEILKYDNDIFITSEGRGYFLSNPKNMIKCNEMLYILDNSVPFIKIFNMKGDFIKSFGKEGKGPGEFLQPELIKSYKDSLLYIYDWRKMIISVYNIGGTYLNNIKFNNRIRNFEVLKKNQIVYSIKLMNNIRLNEPSDYKIFLYTNEKNILLDSIKVEDKVWFENRKLLMSYPFIRKKFFYKNNLEKLIIVDNISFQFKIFNNFDPIISYIKNYPGKKGTKITYKNKDEYFKTRMIVDSKGVRTNNIPDDIRKSIKFPEYKPIISSVFYALDNNVWFKLNSAKEKYDKVKIFKGDGNYVKTVLINKNLLRNPLIFNENFFIQKEYVNGLPVIKRYIRKREIP